jgi:hypothetical protein
MTNEKNMKASNLCKSVFLSHIYMAGFLFYGVSAFSQTGEDLVKKMHNNYFGRWYRTFTFVQTTEIYRNDSLIRTGTWYEAAHFPYKFRIDLGDPKDGNAVIYLEDSTYRFHDHKLISVTAGTNPFTFLLGGMYAVPFDSVLSKFKHQGYDLSKTYTATVDGRKVFVVGAVNAGDSLSNQFWVDSEHYYIVRTINSDNGNRLDAKTSGHVQLNNGWSETRVVIYVNGKLRQVEKYADLKADVPLDDRLFDPKHFGEVHWFK